MKTYLISHNEKVIEVHIGNLDTVVDRISQLSYSSDWIEDGWFYEVIGTSAPTIGREGRPVVEQAMALGMAKGVHGVGSDPWKEHLYKLIEAIEAYTSFVTIRYQVDEDGLPLDQSG